MATKFNLSSKHWILLSLVLLALSSYPYKKMSEQHAAIQSRVKNAQAKMKKEEAAVLQIESNLSASSLKGSTKEPRDLVKFYQELTYGLRNIAAQHKIEIQNISPRAGARGSGAKDMSAIAISLPASPGVKVLSINISGRFNDDELFRKFLDFLAAQDVSIGALNITREMFQLQLDVFGV